MTNPDKSGRIKGKVTQALIAREAGVSQTLVSIVLNDASAPERVAEDTRKRILETAKALGYQVKGGGMRKKALALILPVVSRVERLDPVIYDAIDDFYARTQKYVAEAAYYKGYSLIVRYYQEPVELTHWLTEWGVEGVLWQATDDKLLDWISQRFPVAQLQLRDTIFPVDTVTADQEEIPMLALRYLYERGHRRICFVPGTRWGRTSEMRANAFRKGAAAMEITIYEQFLTKSDVISSWDVLNDCLRLVELPAEKRPSAFVLGDPAALVLAGEIQKRGYVIPRDFSIMGIDNISAGSFYNPALTSIEVCQKEVSGMAVEMVINRIANPDLRHQKVFISPKIIERESVGSFPCKESVESPVPKRLSGKRA